jgi:hypothetical protein
MLENSTASRASGVWLEHGALQDVGRAAEKNVLKTARAPLNLLLDHADRLLES